MTSVFVFLLMLMMCGEGMNRSVDQDEPVVAILTGSFYALESLHGKPENRLSRRHLGSLNNSSVQAMRLDLGPEIAALDMELSQDSVWTDDSVVLVRRGEQVEEVRDAVDSNCFLSGHLTSHNGAASLNRCGRLSGMIQTGDFHYEIEEAEEDNLESEFSNVKVIMRRSEDVSTENDLVILNDDLLGSEDEDDDFEDKDLSKRQNKGITAEVATFLDANFAKYMKEERGKKTAAALSQWIVMKWNVIRKVYGNADKIGVPFSVQLKKVEIWWKNPAYYARLGVRHTTDNFLTTFCEKSSNTVNYDHKMLYTKGTGTHEMGMAYLNGICRPRAKCSLVKSKTDQVKIELHEFGHTMGLDHDPELKPCSDPSGEGGFMGWGSNYRILDCYRREILKRIRERGARCLYERNVNLPILNPAVNAQKKNPNKKKQGKNNRPNNRNRNRNRNRNNKNRKNNGRN